MDLRDFSVGPAEPTFFPATEPMIAIPGGQVYWFTSTDPQQVAYLGLNHDIGGVPVGFGPISKPVAEVFPQLPADRIVDATIVYGDYRAELADATGDLSDADVRSIVHLAGPLGAKGEELMAALHLLSGLRPAPTIRRDTSGFLS